MAVNDQHRVTKDTSTRKNTNPSDMRSGIEATAAAAAAVAAQEASHKAFIEALKAGYEAEIEAMKVRHEAGLTGVKQTYLAQAREEANKANAAMEANLKTALKGHRDAVTAAKAMEEHRKKQITALTTKLRDTESQVKDVNDEVQRQVFQRTVALHSSNSELQQEIGLQKKQITKLEKDLRLGPNSWVDFTLQHRGSKDRVVVRRLFSKLSDLELHIREFVKNKDDFLLRFSIGDVEVTTAEEKKKTLVQAGIKSRSAVAYWWVRRAKASEGVKNIEGAKATGSGSGQSGSVKGPIEIC